jgi:7-cyano-7-deazaguanine reductase
MNTEHLTQLGQPAEIAANPEESILETVPDTNPDTSYLVRFTSPEFTSLCPITGQPDFAHLVIDYAPDKTLVESKSLKLFLSSFRNHGAFHEDCTVYIGERIFAATKPHWLRIGGYWFPRGGIPIDVFHQIGEAPKSLWIPDQGVPTYRGRG